LTSSRAMNGSTRSVLMIKGDLRTGMIYFIWIMITRVARSFTLRS
jgi:hypothetical protein